ncbi:MAG: ABC transporter permease [Bacteroidales bacterium]|nr:ABC transporter permease [Bacteroidales bacterium]
MRISIGESVRIARAGIRGNRLRCGLTIAIIAVGITSLVGILTCVDSLKNSVQGAFSQIGASSFVISGQREAPVLWHQAQQFQKIAAGGSTGVAIYHPFGSGFSFSSQGRSTTPNMSLSAIDGHYGSFHSLKYAFGRPLSEADMSGTSRACVIGHRVAQSLFGSGEDALGKSVTIQGERFTVVGVLERMGATGSSSSDKNLYVPVSTARSLWLGPDAGFQIGLRLEGNGLRTQKEIGTLMRSVRGLRPAEKDDFSIRGSESAVQQMEGIMDSVTLAALVIGLITLLGAAAGLMNIMLVAVKERTREIGLRKALGASHGAVRMQFLMESIIICLRGGAIGIATGIVMGNLVAVALKSSFVLPWLWMLTSVLLCVLVGLLAGMLPARRACLLDPVEALRCY